MIKSSSVLLLNVKINRGKMQHDGLMIRVG